MFAQTLKLHWKAARWFMLPLVLVCFAAPQFGARVAESMMHTGYDSAPGEYLGILAGFLPIFPVLAMISGVVTALTAWTWDHRMGHIYSLALPVTRREYTLLKGGAGALVLLLPTVAIALGALMVELFGGVPDALQVYVGAFSLRFLVASLLIYAAIFALASGTVRTTVIIISAILVLLILTGLLPAYLPSDLDDVVRAPGVWLANALTSGVGPLGVFGGSWMFIDV